MKKFFRNVFLKIIALISSEIRDSDTGEKLGRGLFIAWRGKVHLIGYEGRALVPKFLPQKVLVYWKQDLGFTARAMPDFSRIAKTSTQGSFENARVLNFLLTHQGGEAFEKVRKHWEGMCGDQNLWVVFGGTKEAFEKLNYPRKIFVDDPALRTLDHQREKQCYLGVIEAIASTIERESPDFIHLCEYDHLPLIPDLNQRQVQFMDKEGADVMVHYLKQIDGTAHPFELYHESDPEFIPFWKSVSIRDNPSVILWMFGSGSVWTKNAFLSLAHRGKRIECLFEIYLPTLAHHLGFRVRGWNENQHLISNLPSPQVTVNEGLKKGCWTVHPVKEI